MALEYVLYVSADLATEEILSIMAVATGGEILGNFVRREALGVTPYRDEPGEESSIGEMLGFTHRLTATYRLSGRWNEEDRAAVVMAQSALAFFDRYKADGVLLYNDSRIVLQQLNGSLLLAEDWEDRMGAPGMREVVRGIETRALLQPLL